MTTESTLPWVEKYRPRSLEEVVSHYDIVKTLDNFITRHQLPHLLFHGPPGTGKTSVAQAIARKLYGSDFRQMVLELNASDDRGIVVVRETIKLFAETRPNISNWFVKNDQYDKDIKFFFSLLNTLQSSNTIQLSNQNDPMIPATNGLLAHDSESRLAPIKLIILDEADQMTGAAQMALRRIIENYAKFVRFFIICNYVNKINPALQSRCTKFRFSPLPKDDIIQRTLHICEIEKVQLHESGLEALIRIGKGDMRKIINSLQSAAMGNDGIVIDERILLETVGRPLPSKLDTLLPLLTSSPLHVAFNGLQSLIKDDGYALSDILNEVYERIIRFDFPTSCSCIIYPRLADIQYRLSLGADELIQVGAFVAAFIEIREDLAQLNKKK